MCGIAGFLARSPDGRPPEGVVARLSEAMVHRGPDGHGLWEEGPAALGHRRLAIVDLSEQARQPIANEDGQVIAVVNGEIYNHRALRHELEARGHVFRSDSDSEVVVHLYEELGAGMPARLDGMFALAVWDRRARRLLLARDRAGEKPLVYTERPDGLAFASEIAALLADRGTVATLDPVALDAYLALQYVPAPATIFREIRKLPPGSILEAAPGEAPRVSRYHRVEFTPAGGPVDEVEACRQVRAAVEASVAERLMSDVPLGAFLSGGLDSSIVVACMARASGTPVKTFSIGFPEASELPFAREVARRWQTDHEERIVSPRMVDVLPLIVRHHGEPFGDASAVPSFYLAQMTRRRVTVALSGDGGDEAFGGYRRYVWAHVAHLLGRLPAPLRGAVAAALGWVPGGPGRWVREYGAHLGADEAGRYLRFICHFSAREKAEIYAPDLAAEFHADRTAGRFAEILARSGAPDPLGRLMDLDTQTYLPDDILTKVDIASMAHGLEARAPLVDHRVMELAAHLPARMKVRGLRGKVLLKRAFADVLPPSVIGRRKRGFSLPLERWMRHDLRDFARDHLLGTRARSRGLFRPERVEALLERHLRGEDHGERLWNLLCLELWSRQFVDGRQAWIDEIRRRAEARRDDAPQAWTGTS